MTTKTTTQTAPRVAAKTVAKATSKSADKAVKKPSTKAAVESVAKTADKKDVQKLQRAVVDGLEDVKAQDIVVFDTEHLSPLFERVIVASGTSNRQTKALAASVVDAVREAGFPKPRVEGEVNGEWIIVDCGQAVVHVMQPNFRTYYNLEELWGEKPVRLKLGAVKPGVATSSRPAPAASDAAKPAASLRRSSAAKKGVEEAFPSKAQLKKTQDAKAAAAKKVASKAAPSRFVTKKDEQPVAKPKVRTLVVNAPGKPAAKKATAKPAARAPAKSAPAKKTGRAAVRKA